jgi:hypothetical protein
MATPLKPIAPNQENVKLVAQMYGMSGASLWDLIQKLDKPIQDIVMILIHQNNAIPGLAQAGEPLDVPQEEINRIATFNMIDSNTLSELLQKLGPVVAQLLLTLLAKPKTV